MSAKSLYLSVVLVIRPVRYGEKSCDDMPDIVCGDGRRLKYVDKDTQEKSRDFTFEANVFLQKQDGGGGEYRDIHDFLSAVPLLYEIDVVNQSCVWLFVSANGTFDRMFVGKPWDFTWFDPHLDYLPISDALIARLPICDVSKIMHACPEGGVRRLIASIERTDVRDQWILDRGAAVVAAKNKKRKDAFEARAALRRQRAPKAADDTWWNCVDNFCK